MIAKRIQFGKKQIEFRLQFTERKTLGITVTPNREVIVKAPHTSSIERIKNPAVLESKGRACERVF